MSHLMLSTPEPADTSLDSSWISPLAAMDDATDDYRAYPELYNEYIRERVDHLIYDGTYLNPLDSKILNGLMTVFVLITAAVCVAKICKLHLSRHPTIHQYLIFYLAVTECLICSIHWILSRYMQLDFVAIYLKLLQFLVVSHLYWCLASRAVQKEKIINRVLLFVYLSAFVYFTVVVVTGCVKLKTSWEECLQPYWLMLSIAEFLLAQLFLVSGIFVTRRLSEISTLECVRRAQKRDIWVLVVAFQISSFCGCAYDVTRKTLGQDAVGCNGIFLHMDRLYSPTFACFMIVKLLLPMWAMLFVFHPIESTIDQDDYLPPLTDDARYYTSVFSPFYDRHRYRQLSHPAGDLLTSDTDLTAVPASGADVSTPVLGALRRNASSLSTIKEEPLNTDSLPLSCSDRSGRPSTSRH